MIVLSTFCLDFNKTAQEDFTGWLVILLKTRTFLINSLEEEQSSNSPANSVQTWVESQDSQWRDSPWLTVHAFVQGDFCPLRDCKHYLQMPSTKTEAYSKPMLEYYKFTWPLQLTH